MTEPDRAVWQPGWAAGCLSPQTPDDVIRFIKEVTALPGAETAQWPSTDPIVAFAWDPGADAEGFQAEDGSIALVMGRPFALNSPLTRAAGSAESILSGFRSEGVESLLRYEGGMSAAIWDAESRRLFVIRDRWGSPPLGYTEATEPLLWSTDLGVLIHLGVSTEIDPVALDCYLGCGALFSPLTMLAAVRRLPTAHLLSAREDAEPAVTRYWKPRWGTQKRKAADTRVAVLRDLMIQAIEKRLDPEGPTAVLLSSGVDSSLLIAGARAWLDADVTGFTFRYTDYEGPNNEGPAAKELADYVGADFVELELGPEYVADHVEDMVAAYGEPFGYGLHTSKLDGITERGFRVALSGMCTDDWWPSSQEGWSNLLAENAGFALPAIGRGLEVFGEQPPAVVHKGRTLHDMAALPMAEFWYDRPINTTIRDEDREAIYRDPTVVAECRRQIIDHAASFLEDVADERRANQAVQLRWQLAQSDTFLRWNYHWGRTHGLAIEAPYTDSKLIDFLAGTLRPGPGKTEVRELAASIVPRSMAFRGKYGQEIPLVEWFRGPLASRIRAELDPERIAEEGTFRPEVVSRYVDEHLSGAANHKWVLWELWCYLTWHDMFVTPVNGR